MEGRGYITPEDVRYIGIDVLRHRIILTYEAEAEELTSEDIIQRLFDFIAVSYTHLTLPTIYSV